MLNTKDYHTIYQAYIDTIQFHLENSTGVIKWSLASELKPVPSPLSLIDQGNDAHNIPDYFDFMLSLIENNSYWLFLIDPKKNILEGKHRLSALQTLIKYNIVGQHTKIMTATMNTEHQDKLIDVFFPTQGLDNYLIDVSRKRFPKETLIYNEQNPITIVYNYRNYRVEKLTVYEFMVIYNTALKQAFINNSDVIKPISLNSVRFKFIDSKKSTIERLVAWKTKLIQEHQPNSFWQQTATTNDHIKLYQMYLELLQTAESQTNQDGNSLYRTVRWIDLTNDYNLTNQASPIYDWFSPLDQTEKDRLVDTVVKYNFPFVILIQNPWNYISALSRAVVNLIAHGVNTKKIPSSISLKVIVVDKIDQPNVDYHFPHTLLTPDYIPIKHYLIDFLVYDWHQNSYIVNDLPFTEISHRFFDIALHWYEQVLWQYIDVISQLDTKLNTIIWS